MRQQDTLCRGNKSAFIDAMSEGAAFAKLHTHMYWSTEDKAKTNINLSKEVKREIKMGHKSYITSFTPMFLLLVLFW